MSEFICDIHYLLSLKGVLDSSLLKNGTNDKNVQKTVLLFYYGILSFKQTIIFICSAIFQSEAILFIFCRLGS